MAPVTARSIRKHQSSYALNPSPLPGFFHNTRPRKLEEIRFSMLCHSALYLLEFNPGFQISELGPDAIPNYLFQHVLFTKVMRAFIDA